MNPATELARSSSSCVCRHPRLARDARNRQAIDAKLAYTEFLALLVQDGWPGASRRILNPAAPRGLPRHQDPGGFEFDRLPSTNRALVHDLATGRCIQEKARCSSWAPAAPARATWPRPSGTARCARAGRGLASCAQLLASLNAARAIGNYESESSSSWPACRC